MTYDSLMEADIKGEFIDRRVKIFANGLFKLKQVCTLASSSNWKETYYKEAKAELTATDTGTGIAIKGTPRLAAFPNLNPTWEKTSSYHIKHAGEATVSWEDAKTSAIDVMSRTLERVARAIANSVDIAIYDAITADANVNTLAAEANWDSATIGNRNPIADILHGIEYCSIDNFDILENGYMLMNPENYTNLIMHSDVIKHPTFESGVMQNGRRGNLLGLKIIVSNAIDADEVCLLKGGTAVTYKTAQPLTTATIKNDLISYTIRASEIGITMITAPEAIHIITNTEL